MSSGKMTPRELEKKSSGSVSSGPESVIRSVNIIAMLRSLFLGLSTVILHVILQMYIVVMVEFHYDDVQFFTYRETRLSVCRWGRWGGGDGATRKRAGAIK